MKLIFSILITTIILATSLITMRMHKESLDASKREVVESAQRIHSAQTDLLLKQCNSAWIELKQLPTTDAATSSRTDRGIRLLSDAAQELAVHASSSAMSNLPMVNSATSDSPNVDSSTPSVALVNSTTIDLNTIAAMQTKQANILRNFFTATETLWRLQIINNREVDAEFQKTLVEELIPQLSELLTAELNSIKTNEILSPQSREKLGSIYSSLLETLDAQTTQSPNTQIINTAIIEAQSELATVWRDQFATQQAKDLEAAMSGALSKE